MKAFTQHIFGKGAKMPRIPYAQSMACKALGSDPRGALTAKMQTEHPATSRVVLGTVGYGLVKKFTV
jgi:hypothetical protein